MLPSSAFQSFSLILFIAFPLGTEIGLENQYRYCRLTDQRAGRNAAAFAHIGACIARPNGTVRVIADVVWCISPFRAGVIVKEGEHVRGLTTAATPSVSAAIGAFASAGQEGEAVLVAFFVLARNTLLRPLVDFVNRRPIRAGATEAIHRMHVVWTPDRVSDGRDLLAEELKRHRYPLRKSRRWSKRTNWLNS